MPLRSIASTAHLHQAAKIFANYVKFDVDLGALLDFAEIGVLECVGNYGHAE